MVAQLPDSVKATILRSVAAAAYPRQALPDIALRHELSLDDVKHLVEKHGWPRPDSMRRAAAILEQRAKDRAMADEIRTEDTDHDVLVDVPLDRLRPDPGNPRADLGDLSELAASMTEAGLVQPVVVRRDGRRLIVVAGHRRVAAARHLSWTSITCVIRAATMSDDDVLVAMLAENGQRQPLDPIDEARALARLKEREGLTDLQLGRRISRSQPFVSGRLALLGLDDDQQAKVRAGLIPLGEGTRAGRHRVGSHRPNAQGKKSAAHLTEHHPLAPAVMDLCRQRGHHKHTPGRVGGVGCGHCWEDVIRADEREQLATGADR